MDIPFLKVSRAQPVLTASVTALVGELETAELIISRVGDNIPFAAYPFTSIVGSPANIVLKFQFDELLFSKPYGRFRAALAVNGEAKHVFYIQYEPTESISIRAG